MGLKSRAKILVERPVDNIRSKKDLKASLGQMVAGADVQDQSLANEPSQSDIMQGNLLNLHKSIESELGILGSASAIALA